MSTYDVIVHGGTVVDGTGSVGVPQDIAVADGRIVAVGEPESFADATATEQIDATGLIVCPGFIDPHTHYDAQILWDPQVTPSANHGVTTIIMGNCGFSIAPLGNEADAKYIREMLVKVEGMSLASLEQGTDWSWRSFPDYLSRIEGRTAVNVGAQVGHSAIRRLVMGEDAVTREATAVEIDQMKALIREAVEAGAVGFSTTQSFTHTDATGAPVPSRWCSRDELVELCGVLADYDGTTLEWAADGCLRGFTDDELNLMADMSAAANRPINWNVLTIDSARPDDYVEQIKASEHAAARGGRVVALTMPILAGMNMSFGSYCGLNLLPGWNAVLGLPIEQRIERLKDPVIREMMEKAAAADASVVGRLTGWRLYRIGDTFSDANDGLTGRRVDDIAAERHTSPFDTLLDIVLADDLRTVLWPGPTDDDDESWQLRKAAWDLPDVMIGGSDAGAHLDRMAGSSYPTEWLADCLHGRQLTSMENAIRHLTQVPAGFFGLHDRGVIAEGNVADVVVFDPAAVGAEAPVLADDLPGGGQRLMPKAKGVHTVLVNGSAVVAGGQLVTDAFPGRVLRSGTDTRGTAVRPDPK